MLGGGVVAVGGDGHGGKLFLFIRKGRQAVDVEPPAGKQPGDPQKDAGVIFHNQV